ncbi:DUF4850 domain-containing protein [Paenibacillus tepidiphilus]|uniref:DUF4850 domain-containing protein n=1 Tax=Paenibacillus tepidiphilus TaxID=2608683 RepID=UPI0013A585BD|nr:DUF4850 domain-containing protein [Paenibacillus tepidiphilus]
MGNSNKDWEEQMKNKPFADGSFSPQLQQNVLQRLEEVPRSRSRRWAYSLALLPLAAVLLLAGYSSGWFGAVTWGPEAAAPLPAGTAPAAEGGSDSVAPVTPNPAAEPPQPLVDFPAAEGGAGTVPLPLSTILAVPSVDDGSQPSTAEPPGLPEMTDALPAGLMGELQAALVYHAVGGSGYLLLAPKGWQASAVIGANGSYGTTFTDPENPQQTLHYTDNNWGCHGCAVVTIGSYFPGKTAWAESYGYSMEPLNFTRQEVLGPEQRMVRYTEAADADGYVKEGALYYEEGEWGYHIRRLEFTLSPDSVMDGTRDTVLSFFQTHQGALQLPVE